MARYILIDSDSGYIFGDSAELNGAIFSGTALEYVAALDASIGEHGRSYEMMSRNPGTTSTGYDVYRADVDGTEAVAVVWDGQDRETIAAVERDCRHEGFICCTTEAA